MNNLPTLHQNLAPLLAWHNLPTGTFEPSASHQSIHAAGWLAHAVHCAQCELAGKPPPRDIHQHAEKWLSHSPQARDFTHDPRVHDIILHILQGHTPSPIAQDITQQLQQEPYLTLRRLQQAQPFRACTLPQLRAYLAWQEQLQAGVVRRVPFELALLHVTHLHLQQDIAALRGFLALYGPHDRSIARRLVNLLRARGMQAELPERIKLQPVLPPAPPAPEPRKPVTIDFAQLDDIRHQAAEMTELLLVEDALPLSPAVTSPSSATPQMQAFPGTPAEGDKAARRKFVENDKSDSLPPSSRGDAATAAGGSNLHAALTPAQTATVNAMLAGSTASELDIDAINEIAWQVMGDNLIEHGQIISEYINAWKEGTL